MELEWIEDYLSLADTRSFSQSANLRNLSQAAFSRRIQALERWLGTKLVDRSTNPPILTIAGRNFRGFAIEILQEIYHAKDLIGGIQPTPDRELKLAIAYTLSLTQLPLWLQTLNAFGDTSVSISEMNVMKGAASLVSGEVDFLMCYHHPKISLLPDTDRYEYILLGQETLRPYSQRNEDGTAVFPLPGTRERPLPFLAYASNTYFAQIVDMLLLNAPNLYFLDTRYHGEISETMKNLTVLGNGITWLPEKCAEKEIKAGNLTLAGGNKWSTQLEVRLFRSSDNKKPLINNLWGFLKESVIPNNSLQTG